MVSGHRMQNRLLLGIILLLTEILYCTSTDDQNSSSTNDVIVKAIEAITPKCVLDSDSVSFFMYSKNKPYGVDIGSDINCDKQNLSSIRPYRPILVTVHGFTSTGNNTDVYSIIQGWVNVTGETAISLDWSIPACHSNMTLSADDLAYINAVKNTRVVAKNLGESLVSMNKTCGVPIEMIFMVGHSLGAHLVGLAAKHVQEITNATVHKIVGLDPAAPLFTNVGSEERLSPDDAKTVLAIHTSILGFPTAIGDTDIYVNNAFVQPGCDDLTNWISCSHSFSMKVMRDSFRPDCPLVATPCSYGSSCLSFSRAYSAFPESNCTEDTCNEVNIGSCMYRGKGVMYLRTTKKPPYCRLHSKEIKNCTLLEEPLIYEYNQYM